MELTPLHIYLIFLVAACISTAIYIAYIKKQGKTATEQTQQTSAPVVNKQIAQLIRNQKKLETRLSDLQVAVRLQPETKKEKNP
jgi:cell division protein FtsB